MSDTKLLQAILNGQTVIRDDIKNLDTKLSQQITNNTQRLEKIGTQLAFLEHDSTTREEFDYLTKDVTNLKNLILNKYEILNSSLGLFFER